MPYTSGPGDPRPPEGDPRPAGGGSGRGGPGEAGGSRAVGRTRIGRALATGVALVEAALVAAAAVTALLSGLQDGSLVLGAAVAGVATGVAWLLVEAARGFAQGRRWPTGIFVTVQVLVALVALSLGGRALLTFADNPGIGVVTLSALALAAAGLVAVRLLGLGRDGGATTDADDEVPPVY